MRLAPTTVFFAASLCAWSCTCGKSTGTDDAGQEDAGPPDAGPVIDSGTPDGGSDAGVNDAGNPDAGQTDAGMTDGGSCPTSADPVACDDGTGSLGTNTACPIATVPGSATSYHLRVYGSRFTPLGACLYVTPTTCASASVDVLQFSGGQGTGAGNTFNGLGEKTPYCFRLLSVAWDANWADDGKMGNVLNASQRPQAVIEWVHSALRSSATTPLCATGGSAGSSLLLYQLMHNDGETLLDHVQLVSATPYARFDKGCDLATPQEGTNVVCSALPAVTSLSTTSCKAAPTRARSAWSPGRRTT